MNKPLFYIRRQDRLPIYKINEGKDFHFFPFFVDQGVQKNSNFTYNNVLFEQVFQAKKTNILKWLDAEDQMSIYDLQNNKIIEDIQEANENHVYKRNIKIGKYFVGKTTTVSYQTQFKKKYGLKLHTSTPNIKVYLTDKFFWDDEKKAIIEENLFLFFMSPRLSKRKVLYISTITIYLNAYSDFVACDIVFNSLDDKLNENGIFIDSAVQFSLPGSIPILPKIANKLIHKYNKEESQEIIFYNPEEKITIEGVEELKFNEIENTQQIYIDDFWFKNKPLKNIQIKINDPAGIGGFKIVGRKVFRQNIEDGLIIGKAQNLFIHKLQPANFTHFDKTEKHDNNFTILSGLSLEKQIWTDTKDLESVFSNVKPGVLRPSHLILLTKDKNYSDLKPSKEAYNLIDEDIFELKDKNKLIGKHNIRYSKFSNYEFNDNDVIDREKLRITVYDENKNTIETDKISAVQFLNYNPFLIDNIKSLSVGQFLLSNNRGLATQITNSALGLFGTLVKKITSTTAAFLNPQNIISNFFQFSPNSWYIGKQNLKLTNKVNLMFQRDIVDFFAANLPKGRINSSFYIPIDYFVQNYKIPYSATFKNVNQIFNCELTERVYLKNKTTNNIELVDTETIKKGTHKIDIVPFETSKSLIEGFIIDAIEIKMLGARDIDISTYDINGNMINFFKIQSQSKYSQNITELCTFLQFGYFNEQYSNNQIFNLNVLDQQEKQAFSLFSYQQELAQLITANNKEGARQQLYSNLNFDLDFSPQIINLTHNHNDDPFINLNRFTDLSFATNNNILKNIDWAKEWDGLILSEYENDQKQKIKIFASADELKGWLLSKVGFSIKETQQEEIVFYYQRINHDGDWRREESESVFFKTDLIFEGWKRTLENLKHSRNFKSSYEKSFNNQAEFTFETTSYFNIEFKDNSLIKDNWSLSVVMEASGNNWTKPTKGVVDDFLRTESEIIKLAKEKALVYQIQPTIFHGSRRLRNLLRKTIKLDFNVNKKSWEIKVDYIDFSYGSFSTSTKIKSDLVTQITSNWEIEVILKIFKK